MNSIVHEGVDGFVDSLIGWCKSNSINLSRLKNRVDKILLSSDQYNNFSLSQLHTEITKIHKVFLLNQEPNDQQIDLALSIVIEAMDRTLNKRPYPVQVLGALCMYKGYAIEMGTGEGKTLTAALSTALFAWSNKPCHVVTTNDYLAQRDAEILRDFYEICNLTVGFIQSEMQEKERRESYSYNITYATSNNLLADLLKDRMQVDYDFDTCKERIRKVSSENYFRKRVMRGLGIAVIDEADSVLGDDAITPLIISSTEQDNEYHEATMLAYEISKCMTEVDDFKVFDHIKVIQITKSGHNLISQYASQFSLSWSPIYRCTYLIQQALVAKYFYLPEKQYVILEEKIVIVDEKTGRLMDQRSWSHGLHQAIEAKESLPLSDPTVTSEKMSFQSFFRLYDTLTGMSGTFHKIERELWRIYKLPVISIPPRVKKKHVYNKDVICYDKNSQRQKIIDEIKYQRSQGRAILVGTRTVKESQDLSDELTKNNINTTVLNALYHEQEAEIISNAGKKSCVTIATNMAGRGTDILLDQSVLESGGLHVIATERHDSRRVDLQLYGRASRQGQPGSSVAILSMDDQLMSVHLPKFISKVLKDNFRLSMSQYTALFFYQLIQYMVEMNSSRLRVRQLIHEIKFKKSLSFTGKN